MLASDHPVTKYNELLNDVIDGPFYIERADGNNFRLFQYHSTLITYGDYDHITKRAFDILKENSMHHLLTD